MKRTILALIAVNAAMAPWVALASDRSDIIAVVQAYNTAGNKGDRSGYASYCTSDAVVVDHVPPYLFQGPAACADEYDAVVAWCAQNKIGTEFVQKLLDPVFIEVQKDVAYAVFPVKAWGKQNGRKQIETLYLTTVLRRQAHNWRIANLVYSSLGWRPVVGRDEQLRRR
jgi:ketosteroid isomerase-like protein